MPIGTADLADGSADEEATGQLWAGSKHPFTRNIAGLTEAFHRLTSQSFTRAGRGFRPGETNSRPSRCRGTGHALEDAHPRSSKLPESGSTFLSPNKNCSTAEPIAPVGIHRAITHPTPKNATG